MEFRQLGNSELRCSVVGLGTWVMGGNFWGEIEDQRCVDALLAGLDAGINLIDTAPGYGDGHSEQLVAKALKGRRAQVILATKCGNFTDAQGRFVQDTSAAGLRRNLERSLHDLNTDYIDLYQVHWPDARTPAAETFGELAKMQAEGKIRYVGVSNFSVEQMKEARQFCPITSLQPPYSLLDRRADESLLPYCAKEHIGVLSYGSIGAGVLTGKFTERPVFKEGDFRGTFYRFFSEEAWPRTAAMVEELKAIAAERGVPTVQVAINWVLAQQGVTVALVGARTPEQAVMNAGAGSWQLNQAELARIEAAYQAIFAQKK